MDLYKYRILHRKTITVVGKETTEYAKYYLQKSFLGIMWTDMFDQRGNPCRYHELKDAIYNYNHLMKKEIIEEKVVHPIKQIK